jgi:hypothetical protein
MRARKWRWSVLAILAAGWTILPAAAPPANLAGLRRGFEQPPDDARIMMRWWWFGPAVVKPELEREMRLMKEGGIGGFEVQPVYPLELDDPAHGVRNFPYLSDEFIDDLRFVAQKAHELGLRFDLTLCSGWPYGGPHIPIAQAAGRLRVERVAVPAGATSVAVPDLAQGDSLIAAFIGAERVTEIEDGRLRLPADPQNARTVQFFIASHTRMMVKRAAIGAEGFVLDHYDRAAIDNHLKAVGDRLAQAFGATPPYAIFSDSLEVEHSDWTGNFLEEFRKRRGYDLLPYLPALAGDIGEKTAAIRHDWGRTLTELADDNYLTPIREWAHRHGTLFRSQNYGTPPVALSSNALVDLPEGENSFWRRFSPMRWAASASHLYGRPVTSSETWTWLHSPVFRATPLDMKAEADLHFLQGSNQLVGHGWPYSPPSAGEPGWRFYAAAVFNNHNPWWMVMPDITLYLQRISYLLRQGKPANDVALYLPTDDAWAGFTPGNDSIDRAMDAILGPNVMPQILDAGYNYDYIDDRAIAQVGVPYPILILPGVERIPLSTYRKLEEYVRKGGILVATRRTPARAPGLADDADAPKIRELSRALFEAPGAPGHLVTDETRLGAALHQALAADVATAPEIGFVHRKLDSADVYFLANTANHPIHAAATFRVSGLQAAWWDPFNGKVSAAAGARVELDLAPYESRVLVFSKELQQAGIAPAPATPASASSAPATPVPATPAPPPLEVSGPWKVTFPGSAQPVFMQPLRSWTEDDTTKYFSGQATYETTLTVPRAMLASGHALYLTLGEGTPVTAQERHAGSGMRAMLESPVREAAVVTINGKQAGSIWRPPYETEIAALLHAGKNTIRITVANLAINEMAKGPLPDYKALNAKYGERFRPQDMNNLRPLPSGLLGPVRLVAR